MLEGANRGDNREHIVRALCSYVVRAASVIVEALCTSTSVCVLDIAQGLL